MCGRYTLSVTDLGEVVTLLDAILDPAAAALHRPRYNIAPTDAAIVALLDPVAPAVGAVLRPRLVPGVWGLRRGQHLVLNVRSETAATRFAPAYQRRRCVVPADGFYEWTGAARDRRPLWFHAADGAALLMAGLFDEQDGLEGGALGAPPAFAVLTTAAIEPVAAIHDRMPVLLSREGARRWLATAPRVLLSDAVPLAARPVSPRVNATAHDDPACLEPAGPDGGDPRGSSRTGTQLGLF